MSRIAQVLAVILGAIWFFPISCTTGMIIAYPLVSQSHERHMEKGDIPHSMFYVVWQPGTGSEPFGYSKLANLAPADKPVPARAFIMTQPSGRIEGGKYTVVTYKVLSSGASEQLIEVAWADDTYGSVSRYRATHSGVTPVFSRVIAPEFMFKALLLALGFSAAIFATGRWLRRRVARARAERDAATQVGTSA